MVTGGSARELWATDQQWAEFISSYLATPSPVCAPFVGLPLNRQANVINEDLLVVDELGMNVRNMIHRGVVGSFTARHETIARAFRSIFDAAWGPDGHGGWESEPKKMWEQCVSPHLRKRYMELVKNVNSKSGKGCKLGYFPDAIGTGGNCVLCVEFKATDYTISSYETGCRAGGDVNTKVPVNRYAGKEETKNVRKLKLADAQWCVELDGSPRIVGTYKGEPCGPMLHAYAQMKKMYVVMGAHGELSEDGHALITRLTDEIAPEAVHQWRLEGEAGARGETRAIIKYLIRRRIAGATFRAQANHLLNRTALFFGANGPAEDGDAPRPGFRHRADEDRGYDTFDDAYTRFAGRGAWSRGFDPEQL